MESREQSWRQTLDDGKERRGAGNKTAAREGLSRGILELSMAPLEKPRENILERELTGARTWKEREVGISDQLPWSVRGGGQWQHDCRLYALRPCAKVRTPGRSGGEAGKSAHRSSLMLKDVSNPV